MLLNINISKYAQRTIYLEVQVDNTAATWTFSFMGFKHDNSEKITLFDLNLGSGDDLIGRSPTFHLQYFNNTQTELELNVSLKCYYLDSGNKKYLIDEVQTPDPWKMPIVIAMDTTYPDLFADVNFTD